MKRQSLFRSRAGQAATEYILVLVMTLLLFAASGGLLRQFNDSFKSWVRNYYGAYLECLLETGELPKLGYEGADAGCDDEFQPFTLAGGRAPYNPPRGYVAPGTVRTEGDGAGKGVAKNPPDPVQASTSGGGGSESGGGGGSSSISAPPSFIARNEGRSRKVPLAPSETGTKDSNGLYKKGGEGFLAAGESDNGGRPQFVPIETEAAETGGEKSVAAKSDDIAGTTLKPRRVPADVVTAKKKVEAEEGWNLPDFLRWILIAAIVIIMFIVFGGQALQISNGGDD